MILYCFIFYLVSAISFGPPPEYKYPEVPCLTNDFCGDIAEFIYYYRDNNENLVKITPDNLSLNKISNKTQTNNNPAILAYCRCPYTLATLPNKNLCSYRRSEKITAIILQIVLFPLGAGTYYMGWYFWATITMVSGFFFFISPYFYYTNRNFDEYKSYINTSSLISSTIWFILWVIGLILIILNPIDNNGIKSV